MRLAVILGPYRNLSTLTAAILALHPQCQVLNHAADRLLADRRLNFFDRPDPPTFSRFLKAAEEASAGGLRGDFGGSILLSHAYDSAVLASLYSRRYGNQASKPQADCLVWKDSMRIQRRLMQDDALFDRLCSAFPDLLFLLPIRDPLDCAMSNLRTGHIQYLGADGSPTLEETVDLVLKAHAWVLERRERRQDRVFAFTQHDDAPALFASLAEFLRCTPSRDWLEDAAMAFVMRRSYTHSDEATAYARTAAHARLNRWPDIVHRLGY